MAKKSIYLYIAAVLILMLFGYSYFSTTTAPSSAMAAGTDTKKSDVGQKEKSYPPAPDFNLKDLDGKNVRLSDHKGKVVLIDFWATWCPPCRKGIPELVEMQKAYGSKKFVVLGISVDQDDEDKVRDFVKSYQINYPILLYTPDVISAYGGIDAIPTTFIVDKQGKVRQWVQGYRPKEFFTSIVDKLL